MKKIIVLLSLILSVALLANEQAKYTIHGIKDKRLEATYIASYRSVNCVTENGASASKHFGLFTQRVDVPDGNYSIAFPILVKKKKTQGCDAEFAALELIMRRKYDKELASIHPILSSKKKVEVIYWKTKGGAMYDPHPDTPPYLETTKTYFRIPKESTFLCKTLWFPERNKGSKYHLKETTQFHCTMQIDDDVNRTKYSKRDPKIWIFTHPEFGVDKIVDTKMKIDILVDEKNCKRLSDKTLGETRGLKPDNFRELKKPSIWQKLF